MNNTVLFQNHLSSRRRDSVHLQRETLAQVGFLFWHFRSSVPKNLTNWPPVCLLSHWRRSFYRSIGFTSGIHIPMVWDQMWSQEKQWKLCTLKNNYNILRLRGVWQSQLWCIVSTEPIEHTGFSLNQFN